MGKRWLPLESNPDVLNTFSSKLGLNVVDYAFCDIYGLDEELLAMVSQPVLAVLMLFPVTDASEKAKAEEDTRLRAGGATETSGWNPDVYFLKQTISNACGTIGLLHAVANNQDKLKFDRGSFMENFFGKTGGMTAAERGNYLENPPAGAPDIDDAHEAAAQEGNTAPPALNEVVNLHFVTFVCCSGRLYELDGRKSFPVDHGSSSPDTLLQDAVKAVKEFIAASDSINFNLMALSAPSHWD